MEIIIQYTLVFAAVLTLVALGGMFSERSGVINLGLEGCMVMGALGGALAMRYIPASFPAFWTVVIVILVSILTGFIYSLLLGLACITFKADQTITGTALNILAPALATVVVKAITLKENQKASPELSYVEPQKKFVFNMTQVNMSWIIPTILIVTGVVLLCYLFKYKTIDKKKQTILLSSSIGVIVIGIVYAVLAALKVIPAFTFDWGLLLILVLVLVYNGYKLFFSKKEITKKKIVIFSVISVLTIIDLVLNCTGFFKNLTLNWFIPLMICVALFAYFILYYTKFGLRLMACGEHPSAADSVGINVNRMRYIGVSISGCLGGVGGLAFIASVNSSWRFDNGVAGFGFLALAVMIFGQWKPINILLGALLFGLFRTIGLTYVSIPFLQSLKINSLWYSMLPYFVCLIVLMFTSKKSRAPKAEGIPYDKGAR